jgi:hypothetical protein
LEKGFKLFTTILKIPLRLFLCAAVLSLLFSASLATKGSAVHKREIRFTAKWVSGNKSEKSVYYKLDGGSSHLLGKVAKGDEGDFSFDADFDDSIRVYVKIDDSAIYHMHLYINDDLVESGDFGNDGITYEVHSEPVLPTGRIISPVSGSTITSCPVMITASAKSSKGIYWVIYSAYYGGTWHQIATDNSESGERGWSTKWDCSGVTDPQVILRVSAQDNNGNKAISLGGDVMVNMGMNAVKSASGDTTPPDGWITAPAAGAVISQCPLAIKADVTDAAGGVAWVKFWANHDGAWHEITPVVADDEGWSTSWDCSAVMDQNVELRITAQDNAGNQAVDLGGIIPITLIKNGSGTSTPTGAPAVTATPAPSVTPQLALTIPVSPTQTTAPAATPAPSGGLFSCPAAVMPLMVGFGFLAWKKRPGYPGSEK